MATTLNTQGAVPPHFHDIGYACGVTAKATQADVLRALLADVSIRAAEVEAQLADLHVERRGLELSLARLTAEGVEDDRSVEARQARGDHAALPSTRQVPEEWQSLGKTAAVKRVLEEATKPLGPAEIVATLDSVGLQQEDSESVRGALAYMKRKGEAIFVGRSQWVLVDGAVHQRLQREEAGNPTDTDAASDDTEAASVPTHSIMEGGGANGTGSDHDDSSSWQADHRVHGHGAPVGAPN